VADPVSPGHAGRTGARPPGLDFVTIEDVVLFAAGAAGALEAADKQHGHAGSNEDGEDGLVGREPVDQAMHGRNLHSSDPFSLLT